MNPHSLIDELWDEDFAILQDFGQVLLTLNIRQRNSMYAKILAAYIAGRDTMRVGER